MILLTNLMHKAKVLAFIVPILFLLSCGKPNINTDQIPQPNDSTVGIKYPEFKTDIESSTYFHLDEIKATHNNVKSQFFTLDETTNWKEIVEFYDAKLIDKGFQREGEIPDKIDATKSVKYIKQNMFGVQQTLVFSIAKTNYKKTKYQFLFIGSGI